MAYKDPTSPEVIEKMKAARLKHYHNNKEKYIARAKAVKAELRALVDEIKSVPCTDCGIQYSPYVMQFDHLGIEEKTANVQIFINRGNRKALLDEIAKCEVVCANCHAERTHARLCDTVDV